MTTINDSLIYLASPYTDSSKEVMQQREEEICKIAMGLIEKGHLIYCPIAETSALARYCSLSSTAWKFWKKKDLKQISRSDELWIAAMPGWNTSTGVRAETKYCLLNNIPVKMFNLNNMKPEKATMSFLLHCFDVQFVHELND